MKRLGLALIVVALFATAAQAGTVYRYSFDGKVTKVTAGSGKISAGSNPTEFSAWVEFDTSKITTDDVHDGDDDQALYMGNGFVKWYIKIAGKEYRETDLSSTGLIDTLFIVNGTSGISDSISISSVRNGAYGDGFTMYIEDPTRSAIGAPVKSASDDTFTPPTTIDWSKWSTVSFTYDLPDTGTEADDNPRLIFEATVIPLPSAAWIGLGLLGALGAIRRIRRRK